MSDALHEDLVILDTPEVDQTLDRIRDMAIVTQILPPRLALVRLTPEVRQIVEKIDGVLGFYSDAVSQTLNFTAAENLFISAWDTRKSQKLRAGEEHSWDSPGFTAPDLPDADGD